MLAVQEATGFGPEGLKVFAVCPGFVVSNLRGSSDEARRGLGGGCGRPAGGGDDDSEQRSRGAGRGGGQICSQGRGLSAVKATGIILVCKDLAEDLN